ncbi:XdhC family protein [Rhizobium leguminosarum]|uniref:XdhC family protein n=2 Tax=Rhizobium/Agrobacterium group TaxID=227290 RepID=UPI00036FBCE2|nr:XdhC family protein [Rhizobium leguminosarum]NEI23323.1 XdhC family protein [Rhizobium ruizarguesonis]ASS60378.1 xanthine dehydrogenase [Rhizobium leguminosarum bv. viciae]AVC46639.1 xdhC and CoxI family protein [Rhizobium leguminosarum bv. viciae]MBY5854058.1 XdhC family protein [Rhizobium leguminosarum]NEI29372.1 XdhC family protein [Rhizobium ruizarguesonis]
MQCELQAAPLLSGAHPALADPWELAINASGDVVMAVLTETRGPAYRLPGAAMAILPDGSFSGAITSGCVEADLILNASDVRNTGDVRVLRYGEGSTFIDIRLPCGGGIEVMLFPLRDVEVLGKLAKARKLRRPVSLQISKSGRLTLGPITETKNDAHGFALGFEPPLQFLTFGAGPEASVFAALVEGLGYEQQLVSHDAMTLASTRASGNKCRELTNLSELFALQIDARTAAVLFYHDHDYEPEIIKHLLSTPAFYIGAQGSRATQRSRLQRLEEIGVSLDRSSRVRGPIGVIPSSRDPKSLAVSVLAEIMAAGSQVSKASEQPNLKKECCL